MINNNRQAGRRRGRGGQRQGGGNPNSGNRIDNRARGNAAQLLEKYKTLAADAQRQGDRVNAEYYLQFADHYFRVLAESRSRFEEQGQGQRRGREDGFDDDGEEGFDDDGATQADAEPRREREPREDRYRDEGRQDRQDRGNREFRNNRDDRGNRAQGQNGYANGNAYPANDGDDESSPSNAIKAPVEERAEREPPRRGRPRRDARPVESNEGETFDAALLPPSLGISVGDEGSAAAEEAPKPRRGRPRRTPDAEAAE